MSNERSKFWDLFDVEKPVIGMLHLYGGEEMFGFDNITDAIVERMIDEMRVYEIMGVNGVIVENYSSSGKATARCIECFERAAQARGELVVGLNILPNQWDRAISECAEKGGRFVQVDYVAGRYGGGDCCEDLGDINQSRREHPEVTVLGGVWPKYYTPVQGSDLETDLIQGMEKSDAIVVTGAGTGRETPLDKVRAFREVIGDFPLIIGAGLNPENAYEQLSVADGAIVGSYFKKDGRVENDVDPDRVRELMDVVRGLRSC